MSSPPTVTTHFHTYIQLNQALDAFLNEFQRLLTEKAVISFFHLSICLELMSLECLPLTGTRESCCIHSCSITSYCDNMCQSRPWHISHWLSTLTKLFAPVFHKCFWNISITVHCLQLPMNFCYLRSLCAQELNQRTMILLGWMWNVITLHFIDSTSLCWTVIPTLIMQLTPYRALIMRSWECRQVSIKPPSYILLNLVLDTYMKNLILVLTEYL